jgi:hypothetical protein
MPCNIIPGEVRSPDRQIRCCICGYWMTEMEYGGMINGEYVNYIKKRRGNIVMDLCSECLEKILMYTGDNNQ